MYCISTFKKKTDESTKRLTKVTFEIAGNHIFNSFRSTYMASKFAPGKARPGRKIKRKHKKGKHLKSPRRRAPKPARLDSDGIITISNVTVLDVDVAGGHWLYAVRIWARDVSKDPRV